VGNGCWAKPDPEKLSTAASFMPAGGFVFQVQVGFCSEKGKNTG